ncbi:MAG: CopG family transcriptional regulator [Gemmatimonadota bacterium]
MKRTTVFLEEKLRQRLQKLASRRGTSFAMLVREALAEYVARPAGSASLPSVTGRFASGATDTSERVDQLLWKDPHA